MTETKCFRDAFRDQLHELSQQPNIFLTFQNNVIINPYFVKIYIIKSILLILMTIQSNTKLFSS